MKRRLLALSCLAVLIALPARALQRDDSSLSDGEVEQLRESAYIPSDRVAVFIKFLDTRSRQIQELAAKPRRPGHDEDLHDLLEQFTAIADELNDNLDDFAPRHRDLRRQLPKLLEATDRWSTGLRTPPDSDAYAVSRKLALQSVRDLREESTRLIEEQRTYFTAHPEAAKGEREREAQSPSQRPPERTSLIQAISLRRLTYSFRKHLALPCSRESHQAHPSLAPSIHTPTVYP